MRRYSHAMILAAVVAVGPVLAGCSDFDLDKLDVFGLNKKKPLPGERKELFPNGVPGVEQGVPPELMKGYQPPPEPEQKTAEAPPVEEKPKPKARPKPKTRVMVQRPPAQAAQSAAPWPGTQPQQQPQAQGQSSPAPWPGQQQQAPQAAWPAPPPSGTFSR
ncbi:MAG TPA: hypothetical protein VFB45_11605 [Pseudolabrys sp.]|nr:hypothetical protein [Pseudolabrys sp.]